MGRGCHEVTGEGPFYYEFTSLRQNENTAGEWQDNGA